MQGNTTQNISEHLPMTLANEDIFIVFLAGILGILMLTKTKIRLSDAFMILGLLILTFISRRQITMLLLIGSVPIIRLCVKALKEVYGEEKNIKFQKDACTIVPIILMIIGVGILSNNSYKNIKHTSYIDGNTYPIEASEYILENIYLENAKFYNEYNYGSYMLYKDIPVFVDSRADLYAPEFSGLEDDIFSDFLNISGLGVFYEDMFEKYGITHVIAYSSSKLSMIIDRTNDENYIQIYRDDKFVIYERIQR